MVCQLKWGTIKTLQTGAYLQNTTPHKQMTGFKQMQVNLRTSGGQMEQYKSLPYTNMDPQELRTAAWIT